MKSYNELRDALVKVIDRYEAEVKDDVEYMMSALEDEDKAYTEGAIDQAKSMLISLKELIK